MSIFNTLRTTASALTAQRLRLDIISNNIANAETTHTAEGGPYKREAVVFTPQGTTPEMALPTFVRGVKQAWQKLAGSNGGVEVTQIVQDNEAGARMYDPTHPDADADGYVTYPNVNLVTEMTDMLAATRSYEANVTVLNAAKQMAMKTLEIGKG